MSRLGRSPRVRGPIPGSAYQHPGRGLAPKLSEFTDTEPLRLTSSRLSGNYHHAARDREASRSHANGKTVVPSPWQATWWSVSQSRTNWLPMFIVLILLSFIMAGYAPVSDSARAAAENLLDAHGLTDD